MTTLISIMTNDGEDGIVLGSDRQLSFEDDDGLLVSKKPGNKIIVGPTHAIAHAGAEYEEVTRFLRMLRGDKRYKPSQFRSSYDRPVETVEKMLADAMSGKERVFREIAEVNRRMRKRGKDIEDMAAFILAVNTPEVSMWKVDEYGNLSPPDEERIDTEFAYIPLGTGEDKILERIDRQIENGFIDTQNITLPAAVEIAYDVLTHAARHEARSGGPPHIVVLRKNCIENYEREFERHRKLADQKCLEEIKAKYEQETPKRQRVGDVAVASESGSE